MRITREIVGRDMPELWTIARSGTGVCHLASEWQGPVKVVSTCRREAPVAR